MKNSLLYNIIGFVSLVFCFASCTVEQKKYVIGVSQCSDDSWRTKLQQELELSTYFNDEVQLILCSANDNVEKQRQQIDSLVNIGVDLLIVSPQQLDDLSSSISRATDQKIPVILFDRKSDVKNYTAFMGADNYRIGQMLGDYAATLLGDAGTIVEIGGEHGSSPAIERHRGFTDAIKCYPNVHIIGYEEGNWKQTSGNAAMENILQRLERENPDFTINLVFGGNDRMAEGAREAVNHYVTMHPQSALARQSSVKYLGIDALPTPGGGMEKVRDGILTASAIYPTHGDELMQLALNILEGKPYEKNNDMETSLVTSDNANVLLLQNKEIENQHRYIQKMHARVDGILSQLSVQRLALFSIIFVVLVVSTLLVVSVRAYRTKKRLYEQLRQKNEEINHEKATVERQRDELEEQRDQYLDAITKKENTMVEGNIDGELADGPRNTFMENFMQCLDEQFTDPDLSVEDIGHAMCISRVQLYRRVKAITGKTPVEFIREKRLKEANLLLTDGSLSVSEVAYRVGFSAPSYFTKCYKDFYGKSPSGKKK